LTALLRDLVKGERLEIERVEFEYLTPNKSIYTISTDTGVVIKITLPSVDELEKKVPNLKREITLLKKEKETAPAVTTPSVTAPSAPYTPAPTIPIRPSKLITQGMKLEEDSLSVRQLVEKYKNHQWSREILHNKIKDPEKFLKNEFPHHKMVKEKNIYKFSVEECNNLSASFHIALRETKDGLYFLNTEAYSVNEGNVVCLPTDDYVSLSELNSEEIEIVAPFLNQLLTMHRVVGTRLINFLLLPAEVRTMLVLRDPERTVYEFSSYTDLLLMLSHYWEGRILYFNIDKVKKVDSYIELEGLLLAKKSDCNVFDYAEVKFSLDKDYRISVAMVILYPEVAQE
jgi:hypothetical protein